MTKAGIAAQVAPVIGPRVSKDDCALVIDALPGAVHGALAVGERHSNPAGSGPWGFWMRRPRARRGRNPGDGEPAALPARCSAPYAGQPPDRDTFNADNRDILHAD